MRLIRELREWKGVRSIAACSLLGCSLLGGCEKPFEPIAETDLAFSIYGHLDAGLDTQWVRVMPIRQSLETQPDSIDAVVTLEEMETGASVVMTDGLFRFQPRFLGDVELYAHNFSTSMPIVPGRHYRLTATRSDGATASATVEIPTWEFPTMEVTIGLAPTTHGTIVGTRYLAMVLGREIIPPECNLPMQFHQEFLPVTEPAQFEGGEHQVQLSWPADSRPSYVDYRPCADMDPKRVLAVASPEPWIYGPASQGRVLNHQAAIDNVEGRGLGFLAGVYTHVFPYDECTPVPGRSTCTITFDPLSATLAGVVLSECTGEPIAPEQGESLPKPVLVELQGPPENGIRYDTTDASGFFLFEGLEPGAPHSLALEQFPQFNFGVLVPSQYLPLELETVVLPEAAVDTLSIVMRSRYPCPVM